MVAELHSAIEGGLTTEARHSIVGLWEPNNNNDEDLSYESLVEAEGVRRLRDRHHARTTTTGRPTEGAWEWYTGSAASTRGTRPAVGAAR